jgi:hypothetical protein
LPPFFNAISRDKLTRFIEIKYLFVIVLVVSGRSLGTRSDSKDGPTKQRDKKSLAKENWAEYSSAT